MKPELQRVVAASEALSALRLGTRNSFTVVCWMAAKFAGADADQRSQILTEDVQRFCDTYFRVSGLDGIDWFEPLSERWNGGADNANGGWPVGTVWTQMPKNRSSAALRRILDADTPSKEAGVMQMAVSTRSGEASYVPGLSALVPPAKRIPLMELAIWRYRFGVPEGASDASHLVDAMVEELHLNAEERATVFREPLPEDSGLVLVPASAWVDADLASALPLPGAALVPTEPPAELPSPPILQEPDDDYLELAPWADLSLESADVDALVTEALALVGEAHLVLPDAEDLIERCVLALLCGHLVLQGPPGTAKTTLAKLLARAFNCTFQLETATADWSTFDVIGGFMPGRGEGGQEVLRPWLGHVTRAAIHCAEQARRHDQPEGEEGAAQAHWLVIDEFSRAEIDKAVGGLYSVLGGERRLQLWFADDTKRNSVAVPRRFRIIGTMNSVDASFVYTFSQGLTRRFQFVYVGVPREEQLAEELGVVLRQAVNWLAESYPDRAPNGAETLFAELTADPRVTNLMLQLRRVVTYVRYQAGITWPLGTAQLVDVLRAVVLRADEADAELARTLDTAVADRVVPQMTGLSSSVLRQLGDWLSGENGFDRTQAALTVLLDAQSTNFA